MAACDLDAQRDPSRNGLAMTSESSGQADAAERVSAWRRAQVAGGPSHLSVGRYGIVVGTEREDGPECECITSLPYRTPSVGFGCALGKCRRVDEFAAGDGSICRYQQGVNTLRVGPLDCTEHGNLVTGGLRGTFGAGTADGHFVLPTKWHVGQLNGCGLDGAGHPVCVGLGPDVSSVTDEVFVDIATASPYFACGLRADGKVRCWGAEAETSRIAPTGTYIEQCVAPFHWCGLTADGNVECIGEDLYGETRVPTGKVYGAIGCGLESTCVALVDGGVECFGRYAADVLRPPEGIDALRIGVSPRSACALTRDGGVRCWGDVDLERSRDGRYTPAIGPAKLDPAWDGNADAGVPYEWLPASQQR